MIETVRLRFLNSRRSSSGCSGRKVWKTKRDDQREADEHRDQHLGRAECRRDGIEETP